MDQHGVAPWRQGALARGNRQSLALVDSHHNTHHSQLSNSVYYSVPSIPDPVNNGINPLDTKLRATAVGPLGRGRPR